MSESTSEYEQERRAKAQRLRELGVDPYGQRTEGVVALRDCSIEDLAAMHAELETRRVVAERAW